ncbi:MAG TPA: hypothetical protein VM843_05400, partial [Flavisolibacter sp.]|nr:hypothetical protein [Flavisolibacter sp.]
MSFNFNGNLPDSIQRSLSSAMSKHSSKKPLVQLHVRKVSATVDSTVIELGNGNTPGAGINMDPPFHKMVMSGSKVLGIYDVDGNKNPIPEYEAPRFVATGR